MTSPVVMEQSQKAHMTTLVCLNKDCLARIRLGRFLYRPSTRVGALTFCPLCGGNAGTRNDDDENYWEVLSESYELPIEIVKQIYAVWDRNEYQRFGDFVRAMKKEAGLK